MLRRLMFAMVLLVATPLAQAAVFEFGAELDGAQEVPGVVTPGSGEALVLFDDVTSELAWLVFAEDLTDVVTGAHVHNAPAGANGPVEFFLSGVGFDTLSGNTTGILQGVAALGAPQIAALFAGELYINIHTAAVPSGEIRGQILPADVTIVPIPAAAGLMFWALGGLALVSRRGRKA